jgi:sarcosine oxidase gamma subunit
MLKPLIRTGIVLAVVATVGAAQSPQPPQGGRGRGAQQRPQRDLRPVPAGTGVISGRVLTADTGRPLKRARVMVTGGGRPFSATTNEEGRYTISGLPAGTYSVTGSKTGFVDGMFGQRRAPRAGTPIELSDNQRLANVDLRLMRGAVIAGRIADEDGEPLARAMVTVLRQQYIRGEKQMTPAGVDQSDDRGQFRVFGLPPGEYFVSASVGGLERLAQQLMPMGGQPLDAAESTGYAPTYYPGVIAPGEAAPLKVAAAQELATVDFQVQIVGLTTVRGIVSGGAPASVMLLPEGTAAGGRGGGRGGRGGLGPLGAAIGGALRGGAALRAGTQPDGTFTIPNVTPGKYTVIARAGNGQAAATAVQPLLVSGEEVMVSLAPAAGVTVSGTVTLESSGGTAAKAPGGFRITAAPLGPVAALPGANRPAVANERGEFSLDDLVPGLYMFRGAAPEGWTMKAVFVEGREATDQAVEIRSSISGGINVIFTDRVTALSGTVRNGSDPGEAGLTVIVFAADSAMWYPQSRHIQAARTNKEGGYNVRGLPPGDYLAVVVDEVEQGEWFDPAFLEQLRPAASKVRLNEGEQQSLNLKAGSTQ